MITDEMIDKAAAQLAESIKKDRADAGTYLAKLAIAADQRGGALALFWVCLAKTLGLSPDRIELALYEVLYPSRFDAAWAILDGIDWQEEDLDKVALDGTYHAA